MPSGGHCWTEPPQSNAPRHARVRSRGAGRRPLGRYSTGRSPTLPDVESNVRPPQLPTGEARSCRFGVPGFRGFLVSGHRACRTLAGSEALPWIPARVSHACQACRLTECSLSGKRASPVSVFRDLMVSGYRACGLYWVRAYPASPARAPACPPRLRIGHVPSSRKRAFPISVFRVSLIYRKPARPSAGSGCTLRHSAGRRMSQSANDRMPTLSGNRDFRISGFRDFGLAGFAKNKADPLAASMPVGPWAPPWLAREKLGNPTSFLSGKRDFPVSGSLASWHEA